MKSRSFTLVNVPDPKNVKANFVYNFFVNDEKVNDSGDPKIKQDPRYLQKLINANALQAEIPRYVEISFESEILQYNNFSDSSSKNLDFTNFLDKIDSEETITNDGFACIREFDTDSKQRLKQKVDSLSKIFGISFSSSEQSKKISEYLGLQQSDVQSLITPLNDPSIFLVNQVPSFKSKLDVFDRASLTRIVSQVNKRLAGSIVNGADDTSPLSKIDIEYQVKKKSKEYLGAAPAGKLSVSDVEPIVKPIQRTLTKENVKLLGVATIGYIIDRDQIGDDGSPMPGKSRTFILRGANSRKYLDPEVFYGSTYFYQVRSVVRVDAVLSGEEQNSAVTFLVASRPAPSKYIRTEEYQPPNEPDGVFYNFNYDAERGLIIRWQIPSGRSRDTKYFQIFKRKSIYDPFVCIAQIDFDDSIVRDLLREQVRPDRIFYSSSGPVTFYEDKAFNRESKSIYAIAAIDAHGYSSGYSVQTEVGFDRTANMLTLKMISRAGAPKQYPNFYIDPSLDDNTAVDSFTQDALMDSGHKKIDIYFTPDARVVQSKTGAVENAFATNASGGTYTLHILNVDLQKSRQVSIGIQNLRKNL